jgi:hypothetical protein
MKIQPILIATAISLAGSAQVHAQETFDFRAGLWEVGGSLSPVFSPSSLKNTDSGTVRADLPYHFHIAIRHQNRALEGSGVRYLSHREGTGSDGGGFFEVTGHFDGISSDLLQVVHTFRETAGRQWLEESIELVNRDKAAIRVMNLDLGFNKSLYDAEKQAWHPWMGAHELLAVPFLVDPSGNRHRHPLPTLQNGNEAWRFQGKPRLLSEAWVLTDGLDGFLFSHYSQDLIRMARAQAIYDEDGIALRFGGSGSENEKEEGDFIFVIPPRTSQSLGVSRYMEYAGGYREGALLYRNWMDAMGHAKPEGYQPPLHWEPHYDNPWWTYSREHILDQGRKGVAMGCELLYLDPIWNTFLGGGGWDSRRLGSFADFNKEVVSMGLKGTGLHIMGQSIPGQRDVFQENFPGAQMRNVQGEIIHPHAPCYTSKAWQEEKEARINKLLQQEDLKFLMFDFHPWMGSCWEDLHGHGVPMTRRDHAQAYYNHIARIKAMRPGVLIEAHDAIVAGRPRVYLPKYYGHTGDHRWDEHWGFEFMHNPLKDLVEGHALALYYYRQAYNIPLYLHFPMYADNDNLLMFWWMASTVQHLGIGGTRVDFATKGGGGLHPMPEARFTAYQEAVAEYKPLRKFFIDGTFHGINEYAHLHVRPDLNQAVLMVFNLEQHTIDRRVRFRPSETGLDSVVSASGADIAADGEDVLITVSISPMSAQIIGINFK